MSCAQMLHLIQCLVWLSIPPKWALADYACIILSKAGSNFHAGIKNIMLEK